MKKQILGFITTAALVCVFAASCSSERKAGSATDSTSVNTTDSSATTPTTTNSTVDSTRRDTTRSNPPQHQI